MAPMKILLVIVNCLLLPSSTLAFSQDRERDQKKYSIKDIISQVQSNSFDVRTKAEKVYRARKNIKIKIGRLLPGLNFSNTVGAAFSGIEAAGGSYGGVAGVASSLLGFLFPSNWFKLKESKLFFEAERRSYNTLIANQINAAETLAYTVHLTKSIRALFENYIGEMDRVLKVSKLRADYGEDTKDMALQVENLQLLMKHDWILLRKSLRDQYGELAHAIGLPLIERENFELNSITLPILDETKEIDTELYKGKVFNNSLEVKSLKYLTIASRYARKTRTFEFLSPGSDLDANLGLGYTSYVAIGRSKTRELGIRLEEIESNLYLALEKVVDNYNVMLEIYRNSQFGFNNAKEWYYLLKDKFEIDGEYDAIEYVSAIESMLKFHVNLIESQHLFIMANAQLDRLLWKSPHYQKLLEFPRKQSRYRLKWSMRRENSKIERDIRMGRLILPDKKKQIDEENPVVNRPICRKRSFFRRMLSRFKRRKCRN